MYAEAESHELKEHSGSAVYTSYMQPPPKLEDFFAGGDSTETQDSSLTHIYDHHQTGGGATYFSNGEHQDLKNFTGFQAFSANSGSEVDDSAFAGQTQSPVESGSEFSPSMALSYYTNWESFQPTDADPELQPWNYDYFFDPNSLLYDGVPYDVINSIVTEPFSLQQELEAFNYQFNPAYFNGVISNQYLLQDYSPPARLPLPDFPTGPPCFAAGSCDGKKEGSLSAQSIAARQRRRRITEKTQELGKLVPGGQKMNTAEMLQAAYKYIKFLQAQVRILELIGSIKQENGQAPIGRTSGEFQILLESPLIQEKLYSTENCMVPQKFVDDEIIKCNPHLLLSLKKED